jgi:hypothetical protein
VERVGFGAIIVYDEDEDDDECFVVVITRSIIIFSSAEGIQQQESRDLLFACAQLARRYITLGCASVRPIPRCANRNKR